MPIRDTLRRILRGNQSQPPAPEPPARPSAPEPAAPPSADTHAPGAVTQLWLYKFDSCPYCRRVMRDIDTLGISDHIEFRDTRQDPHWRTDLRSRTGRTQVPCLFIDGEPMFESADISAWLKANYS